MLASRRNFWIDGLLLHALSTRLGRILIVFVWNVEDSAWERHVLAPEFEKNLAKSIQKGFSLVSSFVGRTLQIPAPSQGHRCP